MGYEMGADNGRVVITGMGVVTPLGECLSYYLEALLAGRSGITRWKRMEARIESKIGGDMSDFDLEAHLARFGSSYPAHLTQSAPKLLRATPLSGRLTAAAALQAYVDAGLPDDRIAPERFGHVLGGHNLNANYIFDNARQLAEEPEFIEPLFGLHSLDTDVLSVTSELLNLKGPSFTLGGACASSNLALLTGLDMLRAKRADAVLVSGGAIDLDPVLLQGWAIMNAISVRSFNDDPARASRPFDALREGFVPSQGAGAVVLETLEGARARSAPVHAELLGAASSSDASRLPKADLDGQVRAIRGALRDAGVSPDQVDYVNAHATSTPMGDRVEVMAIKQVFGERAYRLPVNATKSMLGHCVMSAALVELVATVLQMENDVLHPTINQEQEDPELDLDFVPGEARQHKIRFALSNAFGFGGLNSSVIVGQTR